MPKGVEVYVENGFAEIDFVDRALRGPGLQKLLAVTPPELVETLTRSGPRRRYRVPTGNAAEAGLIDSPVKSLTSGDTGAAEALATASPAGARPEPQTVKGRAYGGPVPNPDVLGGTSVQTTLVPGSGTGTKAVPPTHAEVIARLKTPASTPEPAAKEQAPPVEPPADPKPAKKAAPKKAPAKTAAAKKETTS